MKRLTGIAIALLLLQAELLLGQTAGQPPVEACKPGNFTVIGYPGEFGPKRDKRFRVRIDDRFDGEFLTPEPIWVPAIQQGVQTFNGIGGANLSLANEGLTDEVASGTDGITTISTCGGGMFACPSEPLPATFPAGGAIAVTLVTSFGGVDRAIFDADIFFNPAMPLSTSPADNQIDFESVLAHELGHAVGLGHNDNCVVGPTVMESSIGSGQVRRSLQSPEMEGVQFLYTSDSSAAVRLFDRDRSLRFDAVAGKASPPGQTVSIYGRGGGRWLATAPSSASWVVPSPPSGRFPGDGQLSIGVNSSNLAAGEYSTAISVNIEGHAGPAAKVNVTLHVAEGAPVEQRPSLTRAGIVSAANVTSSDLAPGGLFTLYGEFLSVATAEATASPLPTRLGGTEVLINGVRAPLLYASPQQLNGQVPAELAPGSAGIVVRNALGQTTPISVTLRAAAPEFFLLEGQALALNPDSTINSPGNPAPRGSFISAFLTGQGPVTPPVSSGRAAPLVPLSRVIAVSSAKIGGQPANLLYFGLAPGFVGLAQANIEIPAGVTGTVPLEITIGGTAQTSAMISVQ